eukprot:3002048-Rhodomonas_salina.2
MLTPPGHVGSGGVWAIWWCEEEGHRPQSQQTVSHALSSGELFTASSRLQRFPLCVPFSVDMDLCDTDEDNVIWLRRLRVKQKSVVTQRTKYVGGGGSGRYRSALLCRMAYHVPAIRAASTRLSGSSHTAKLRADAMQL